ncbi:MAG: 2-succinyl-6-hydroxy-2,4-cyclohexadiene-1-carboxylate synthase [Chloroflexota bacterium]
MSRVLVDGIGLQIEESGSGPPLLLLHGFTGTAATWNAQVARLSASRRTIAVDLLGHGRSEAPAEPHQYALKRQAEGLARLLDQVGASPSAVLGYSMGARIALTMAIEQPDSVRTLLLESPSAGIADAAERARRSELDARLAADIERDGIVAFVDEWQAQPLFASHAALPEATLDQLRDERLGQRPVGLAASLRGGGQGSMPPLQALLWRVRCPSLVIAGALDAVGLKRAHDVAAGIPDARLEVIAGAGHTPHLERPDVFGRLLDSFLASTTDKHPQLRR